MWAELLIAMTTLHSWELMCAVVMERSVTNNPLPQCGHTHFFLQGVVTSVGEQSEFGGVFKMMQSEEVKKIKKFHCSIPLHYNCSPPRLHYRKAWML